MPAGTFMTNSHPDDNHVMVANPGDIFKEGGEVAGVYLEVGENKRLVLVMFDNPSAIHLSDPDFIDAYSRYRVKGGILTTLDGQDFKFNGNYFESYERRHFDGDDTEPIPTQLPLPGFRGES